MPSPEYIKPYRGLLTITKMDDYSVLRSLCNSTNAVACSIRTSTSCFEVTVEQTHGLLDSTRK